MENATQTAQVESKGRKTVKIIVTVLTWVIFAISLGMMIFTIVSVTVFDQKDRNIFGYKAFIVLTDSMSATDFSAGDLIFVKEVDPTTLKEGDVITFQSTNDESYGQIISHKIRSLTKDENGLPGFVTYGTSTNTDDKNVVTHQFVIGKYTGRKIAGVGEFMIFLKSTKGLVVCIFVPFGLLLLSQVYNVVKNFRKYKKVQQDEIQAEKDQIQAEREEAQRMMAELMELKKQLGINQSTDKNEQSTADDENKDGN